MANNSQNHLLRPARRRARLRLAGTSVLLAGLAGAATVYWLGTRSPDLSDDPSMLGFNKREERQMGLLYGKMGTLIEDWKDDLRQPGNQAALIAGFAVVIAAGCFYFARLLDDENRTD